MKLGRAGANYDRFRDTALRLRLRRGTMTPVLHDHLTEPVSTLPIYISADAKSGSAARRFNRCAIEMLYRASIAVGILATADYTEHKAPPAAASVTIAATSAAADYGVVGDHNTADIGTAPPNAAAGGRAAE
jgi:hypothetical protein